MALLVGPDGRTIKQEVDGEARGKTGTPRFVRLVRAQECLCETGIFDDILRILPREVCLSVA